MFEFGAYDIERLKINSDNTILIKPLKESWNREEVKSAIYRAEKACNLPHEEDVLISRNFLEQFLNL